MKIDYDVDGFEFDDEVLEIIEQFAESKLGKKCYACQPCFMEEVETMEKGIAKVTLTMYVETE